MEISWKKWFKPDSSYTSKNFNKGGAITQNSDMNRINTSLFDCNLTSAYVYFCLTPITATKSSQAQLNKFLLFNWQKSKKQVLRFLIKKKSRN